MTTAQRVHEGNDAVNFHLDERENEIEGHWIQNKREKLKEKLRTLMKKKGFGPF